MADNTESIVLEILKRIQADVASLKTGMADLPVIRSDVAEINTRLQRVEKMTRRLQSDNKGMTLLLRSAAGDYDERLRDVENDVRVLKEHDDRW